MKKIYYIAIALLASVVLFACKQDHVEAVLDLDNSTAPELLLGGQLVMGEQEENVAFEYTPADYGFQAATAYTLHIKKGDNEISLGLTKGETLTVSRYALNNALIKGGLVAGEFNDTRVTITCDLMNDKSAVLEGTTLTSEPVACRIQPYVWSVKGYIASATEETTVDLVEKSDGKFILEKTAVNGAFKFVFNHGTTGLTGDFVAFKEYFAVAASGNAIDITEAPEYLASNLYNINLNTNDMTAMVEIPNAAWALIGDFNSWGGDVDLIEVSNGFWISEVVDLKGGFKLRYGASWDVNRGGVIGNYGEPINAVEGGDNLNVPEGKYQVTFDATNEKIYVTPAQEWGLIGNVNYDTGWAVDFFMAKAGNGTYFIENAYLTGEFKIRKDAGWDVNRGGAFDALDTPFEAVDGGSNINVGFKNFYKVVYNPAAETITISKGTAYVDSGVTYPSEIRLTGDFSDINWDPLKAPAFKCNPAGQAEGFIGLCGLTYGFKVTYDEDGGTQWLSGNQTSEAGSDPITFRLRQGDNMMTEGNYAYYMTCDLATNVLSLHKFTKVGIVGSATSAEWDASKSIALTWDPKLKAFAADVTLTAGDLKFVFDNGWTYNLGGTPNNLVPNGDNLTVAAGHYMILLDISHTPYTVRLLE